MALKLYNTLTRTKEEFRPLDPKNVRMYVCGPTVYDFAHIGNARPVIVFDVLFRLLRYIYGDSHVTYVRNITDVDDKINARAAEEGVSIRELTERTANQFHEDVAALGAIPPTHQPRATEYVRQMVAMIEKLIASGHAYPAEGHVLYDINSKPDYGKLARRSLDEMIAGARVDIAPYKKNPMDFVLWKPSKPGEPSWPSPWSNGRPGWHIECSAMSEALLGETFDIHGGGIDLVFPHHENEIAQSESAHAGHPFARVWMHNGFLQVEGEKMSKSLGNFVTIRELLDTENFGGRSWDGDVLRFNMLKTHYRQPIDWTLQSLEDSDRVFGRWYTKLDNIENDVVSLAAGRKFRGHPDVIAALLDDLNTPLAISEIHKIEDAMVDAYSQNDQEAFDENAELFRTSLQLLGLGPDLFEAARQHRKRQQELHRQFIAQQIDEQIQARNEARKGKNFKEADRIRDELEAKGITLKDNPDGTTTAEVRPGSRSGRDSMRRSRSGSDSRSRSRSGSKPGEQG